MENMKIYEATRTVPANALKAIQAGRLKGKSDINPMWRIKSLTEQFGPCGIGWKYTIDRQWIEQGGGAEQAAFVNISLYIKHNGEWSDAIPGTGGSAFITQESKGPYTSDECFKMALTDAISVACKALGFGADVYWDKDKTKYSDKPEETKNKNNTAGQGCLPEPTESQKAYGTIITWIDNASKKLNTAKELRDWYQNHENSRLVEQKSLLDAQQLSAANRHLDQTMKIMPPERVEA